MKVRTATGIGIGAGFFVGAIALGYLPAELEMQKATYSWAWWIVVLSTIFPLWGYLRDKQPRGPIGGFISGLGTGLGFFLLLVGRVI